MAYHIKLDNQKISTVVNDAHLPPDRFDTSGLTEITYEQMEIIKNSKYGHAQFEWIAGQLVENTEFIESMESQAPTPTEDQVAFAELVQALIDAAVLTEMSLGENVKSIRAKSLR